MMAKPAILLLAYGGPDSLDDIPAYLLDIRGGRPTPPRLIDAICERYRLIGGHSPLLAITRQVAVKLAWRIGRPVYIGMRHWQPYIADVLGRMADDGIEQFIAICMAPHYSTLSIAKYREKLEEGLAAVEESTGRQMVFTFIDSWFDRPDYLSGIVYNVRQTLARWPKQKRDQVKIIFTAHSLPEFILEQGDPYDDQLRETATMLARELAITGDQWTFSYQSAAKTGIRWLGPQIEDLVVELAGVGEKDLLIAPIGFIADHVEILYDIDIGLQEIVRPLGVRLERTPMLNDDDHLVEALASLVVVAQQEVF
jgi:ferrochelatase